MNSPLKQYRQLLLIPAFLCTLSLLLFTAIKVSATELPQAVPTVSTYSSTSHINTVSANFSESKMGNTVTQTELPTLTIEGPNRTLLRESIQLVASVQPPMGTPGSAVYPVGYIWSPDENSSVFIAFRSNGITATATITWANAGYNVVNLVANTGIGTVSTPYTVAVSARSISISSLQTTTFAYNEFDGTSIRALVPAQEIDGSIQLDYLPASGIRGPVEEGFIGQAFELNAIREQSTQSNFRFEKPTKLTIVYDDRQVGVDNGATMHLRRWNGSSWVRIATDCGAPLFAAHDPIQNQIEAEICQLGTFAIFGAIEALFLPVIQ